MGHNTCKSMGAVLCVVRRCQPRVHERPRGHSTRGNVSNLNILIQPNAADTRRSIMLV